MDVASGIRFSNLHCAFKGCVWAADCSMAQHWALPSHQSSTQGPKEVLEALDYTGEASAKDIVGGESQTGGLLAYCEQRSENIDEGFVALMPLMPSYLFTRAGTHASDRPSL